MVALLPERVGSPLSVNALREDLGVSFNTEIEQPGARFENLVALHLLKLVNAWNDLGHGDSDLHYVRDKDDREVGRHRPRGAVARPDLTRAPNAVSWAPCEKQGEAGGPPAYNPGVPGPNIVMGAARGPVALALVAVFSVACRTDAQGLTEPGGQFPPPQVQSPDTAPTGSPPPVDGAAVVPDAAGAPPAPALPSPDASVDAPEAAGPAPTWLGPVVRAKDIEADAVKAMVVYAKEIEAEEAQIEMLVESKDDKRWEMGRGDTTISVQSLLAEVIYVEKLRCRRLEARELHAEAVKIQRR